MIGRWLEEHGSELDALVAKIGKETGRRTTVERVACDMLDQALEVFRWDPGILFDESFTPGLRL